MKSLRELRDGSKNYSPDKHKSEYKDILLDELREIENIRTSYPEETIRELAESIERDGLLQPIIAIEDGEEDGRTLYRVIAGHRRLRAFQYLRAQDKPSYNQIKAIVRKSIGDIETVQLIENIQREDLNPSDLEKAVKSIMKREGLKQTDLAQRVGKTRQWISSVLQAEEVRQGLSSQLDKQEIDRLGTFTASELSKILNKKTREKTAKKIIAKGGTQKEARKEVKKALGKDKGRDRNKEAKILSEIKIYLKGLSQSERETFLNTILKFKQGA